VRKPPILRELIVQYRAHPSGILVDARQITDAAGAAAVLVPVLKDQPVELFVVLHLDAKRHVIGLQEIARGGLTEVHVPIRSILTGCLGSRNSHGVILGHSHPSGDCEPSADDLALTRRIKAALDLVEIDLVDHIIVGANRYVSFKETGRLRY
jgi:DNA repair protein RadC